MRCLLVLCVLFLSACDQQPKQSNPNPNTQLEKINVAISSEYEPFAFVKDNKLTGFDVLLINNLFKKIGTKVYLHDIAFQDIFKTLKAKKVDLAIAAISRNNVREKDVDFSVPYHRSVTVVVTKLGSEISNFEDLKGKIVGVEKGTTYEEYLKENHNTTEITSMEKFSDLLKALNDSKFEAIVTGYAEAYSIQANHPDIKIIPINGTEVQYCIAFPKGSPLVDVVNKQIETMVTNGELHSLEKQFFRHQIED